MRKILFWVVGIFIAFCVLSPISPTIESKIVTLSWQKNTAHAQFPYWGPILSCEGSPEAVKNAQEAGASSIDKTCSSLCDLFETAQNLLFFGMTVLLFVLLPLMLVFGGFAMVLSGQFPEYAKTGKKFIYGAISGAALGLVAFLIINTFIFVLSINTDPTGRTGLAWGDINCHIPAPTNLQTTIPTGNNDGSETNCLNKRCGELGTDGKPCAGTCEAGKSCIPDSSKNPPQYNCSNNGCTKPPEETNCGEKIGTNGASCFGTKDCKAIDVKACVLEGAEYKCKTAIADENSICGAQNGTLNGKCSDPDEKCQLINGKYSCIKYAPTCQNQITNVCFACRESTGYNPNDPQTKCCVYIPPGGNSANCDSYRGAFCSKIGNQIAGTKIFDCPP
jgi:Na+-transporting methylmalonyl-CoA/oxaloacetate decarboxylase gamma subunit